MVQFAQHVPQLNLEISEISVVTGLCFRCREPGHMANDCVLPREMLTCYRCNELGHISTKCRARDVYCSICKNNRHVTAACKKKRTPATTAATTGLATRIYSTQEEASGVEELCANISKDDGVSVCDSCVR